MDLFPTEDDFIKIFEEKATAQYNPLCAFKALRTSECGSSDYSHEASKALRELLFGSDLIDIPLFPIPPLINSVDEWKTILMDIFHKVYPPVEEAPAPVPGAPPGEKGGDSEYPPQEQSGMPTYAAGKEGVPGVEGGGSGPPPQDFLPRHPDFQDSYPNVHGARDSKGNYSIKDKTTGEVVNHYQDGTRVRLLPQGVHYLYMSADDWVIVHKPDGWLEVNHHSGTRIQFNDKGDLMIEVARDLHLNVKGKVETKIGGTKRTKVGSKFDMLCGGNINTDAPQQYFNSGKASSASPKYDEIERKAEAEP